MKRWFVLAAFLVFLASPAFAAVADLSGMVDADNYFTAYISTNDNELGTEIYHSWGKDQTYSYDDSPYDWADSHAIATNLTPHTTNYLHIVVGNAGASGALLGDFTLNNGDYRFANGTNHLLTDTANWKVYTDHFGGTEGVLTMVETNGGSWRYQAAIDANAGWIYTGNGYGDGAKQDVHAFRYFSTPITASPEPVSAGLFVLGGAVLAVVRKGKKTA
jgi:hypothetical protein